MKKQFLLVLICSLALLAKGQPDPGSTYKNFPIVITLQFHSLSMPFRNIKSNFSNPGIGIGTEMSFNGKQSFVQQVSAMWLKNKSVGNGLLFITQTCWRPVLGSDVYAETKAGVGYHYAFHPVEAFKQVNGQWRSAGRKGKGMLAVPAGISLGYDGTSSPKVSPFVSYQFVLLSGYSKSIPLVPFTIVQAGTRIHR